MNTTQLECFMTVSNFLNFSRAAEHLRITQPAVSHQISTLEDELGVKLFHRTSKSVRLTQEGYLFTQYADEILKLTGLSLARMKQSQHELPARLGIGCRNTAELRLLQPALERLRREDTAVLPLLRLIPFDSLKNLLMDGEIQVMFSFQENLAKTTRYQPLTNCPVACVCAQDHPLAQFQQLTLDQLKQDHRIAVSRPPQLSSRPICRAKPAGDGARAQSDPLLRQPGGHLHPGGQRLRLLPYPGPPSGADSWAAVHPPAGDPTPLLRGGLSQLKPQSRPAPPAVLPAGKFSGNLKNAPGRSFRSGAFSMVCAVNVLGI